MEAGMDVFLLWFFGTLALGVVVMLITNTMNEETRRIISSIGESSRRRKRPPVEPDKTEKDDLKKE